MKKIIFLVLCFSHFTLSFSNEAPPLTCSVLDENERDPALQEMTYNVGNGDETMLAYVEPDISSFYQGKPPAPTKKNPSHNGLSGKFINLSNETLYLFWEGSLNSRNPLRMFILPAMGVAGTATYTSHHFFLAKDDKKPHATLVKRFQIGPYPQNVYYFDPYHAENDDELTETNLAALTVKQRFMYDAWRVTLDFSEQYQNFTGRSYLANYLRNPPEHFMWRADYFGQQHFVTSRETHFVTMPPENELTMVTERGSRRVLTAEDPRVLANYRDPDQDLLNMTLTVLSCAPRAFEIRGFLSQVEVDHILELAGGIKLSRSSVGNVGQGSVSGSDKSSTRTSLNSWVNRESSPIIDALYRRAADLLRIDEALLRLRGSGEFEEKGFKSSLAERLQLVHYAQGQQYMPHHDFGYPGIDTRQGARFATLLLYLNEGMVGGETEFPQWANAETRGPFKVAPKVGKAVLFYSQLPDGNYDDLSLHAARSVKHGEKWLINLWVWDPVFET